MSVLSIHIDESGNLNLSNRQNPEYCLAMVFHDQDDDISSEIAFLDAKLLSMNCNVAFIHTTPLIRQDKPFENMFREERKSIFRVFARFAEQLPISYTTFTAKKTFYQDSKQLEEAFEHQIRSFIKDKLEYLQSFEKIVFIRSKRRLCPQKTGKPSRKNRMACPPENGGLKL